MGSYRLKKPHWVRSTEDPNLQEQRFPGDVIELSPEAALSLGDRVEPVGETKATVEAEGADEDYLADLRAMTANNLRAMIADRGHSLDEIEGTGSGGNVVKADLVRFLSEEGSADG